MAFTNDLGQSISYNCSSLIMELKADIAEFGGDLIVEVVAEQRQGVTIYKDYNFIEDDQNTSLNLSKNERLQKITASALLILYEQENSII